MSSIRVILVVLCSWCGMALSGAERQPNVVIIYADDLGYADISFNNSHSPLVHTPNIDQLCAQGIYLQTQLTHYVCSPSRAGLLTGQHYTQVGSALWIGGTLDLEAPNIARTFQQAGYRTAAFGKWHNGYPPVHITPQTTIGKVDPFNDIYEHSRAAHSSPGVNAYGFDEWAGFYDGGLDYHNRFDGRQANWWRNENYAAHEQGYVTDMIRDDAVRFIRENRDRPFFLYASMATLHAPYHILNTDLKAMCDVVSQTQPHLAWEHVKELTGSEGRKIGDVLEMRCHPKEEFSRFELDRKIKGLKDLIYYVMSYTLDRTTGDIIDALKQEGILENTIVVFSSDNGASGAGDNTPFRGQKMQPWEGGVRVPAVIWQPGVYDAHLPAYADSNRYQGMTQYLDWYPTLVAAAGLKDQLDLEQLDGIDLSEALRTNSTIPRDGALSFFDLYENWSVIRTDRWKLHVNMNEGAGEHVALFDMQADVGEQTNVADQHPELTQQLRAELITWMRENNVTLSYMPLAGSHFNNSLTAADRVPNPSGDVLRVQAERTGPIADDEGFYLSIASKKWQAWTDDPERILERTNCRIFPGDVLQFDIYVEPGSQRDGIFISPSYHQYTHKTIPLLHATKGLATVYDESGVIAEGMVREVAYPEGKWVRCFVGIGDAAPSVYRSAFLALYGSGDAGRYDVLLDNVVIRGHDGSVRAVIWQQAGDQVANLGTARIGVPDGRYHSSYTDALAESALNQVSLSVESHP